MSKSDVRCPNMNHGRMNVPIQFCPNCGKTVNAQVHKACDATKHMSQRKQGDTFCVHCAKKL